jgi:hypothetical protein
MRPVTDSLLMLAYRSDKWSEFKHNPLIRESWDVRDGKIFEDKVRKLFCVHFALPLSKSVCVRLTGESHP